MVCSFFHSYHSIIHSVPILNFYPYFSISLSPSYAHPFSLICLCYDFPDWQRGLRWQDALVRPHGRSHPGSYHPVSGNCFCSRQRLGLTMSCYRSSVIALGWGFGTRGNAPHSTTDREQIQVPRTMERMDGFCNCQLHPFAVKCVANGDRHWYKNHKQNKTKKKENANTSRRRRQYIFTEERTRKMKNR